MSHNVKITDCAIGDDSKSGAAFLCEIDGRDFWVPYSVTTSRAVNTRSKASDVIVVEAWWAEKNELEGQPV